jgi:hypothetical protein
MNAEKNAAAWQGRRLLGQAAAIAVRMTFA